MSLLLGFHGREEGLVMGDLSGRRLSRREASQCSERELRDVLGLFATGVAVVTTSIGRDGGQEGHSGLLGATISSFNSVSLDPPLILFSLGRRSNAFGAWDEADRFAINILGEHQSAISTRFARALSDKWEGSPFREGIGGVPLLSDALAWLECQLYGKHDGGDHVIFVGKVLSMTYQPDREDRPLVFFGGKYHRLAPHSSIVTPPDAIQWLHGW